ncbi:PH domain-containing protein [Glutamicibacter arilaitensis]|uniref:PH domain-containing protein n=1 Tax=Glutamicibacter arilaitensis TaxID=256701 RepID=UPI00384EC2A6
MIDFNNSSVFKLGPWNIAEVAPEVTPMLVAGEELLAAFKGARDYVVFTNKRLIAVNVQGLTGKKRDYTSLPYSRIQAFSVETAGTFDLDAELELWFSGLGKVSLDFKGKVDIRSLSQIIGSYVL